VNFAAAGMQSLVNAIRGTGATNPIMIPGLSWTNALEKWLQYKPIDTLACPQIIASWHSYNFNYVCLFHNILTL
jgi:hypothetical protein